MPATDTAPISITLSIREVKCLEYEQSARVKELKKNLQPDRVEFNFTISYAVNESAHTFESTLTTMVHEKQKENTKVELVRMTSWMSFHIVNYNAVFKKEKDVIMIPD